MYIKPPFHGCFQLKNSAFFAMKPPWECHVSRAKVPFFLAWLGLALQPQLFAMPVSLLPAPAEAILRTTKETPELPQVLAVMRLVFCVAFFFAWNLPRILRCPQMSPDAQHVEVSLELKETESFRLWIQQGSDPTAFFRLVKSEHHID